MFKRTHFTRTDEGVEASFECERCLRNHTVTAFTVEDAENRLSHSLMSCPCYEERPTPLMKLWRRFFKKKTEPENTDPLRLLRYFEPRKSWRVQCPVCLDTLFVESAETEEGKQRER